MNQIFNLRNFLQLLKILCCHLYLCFMLSSRASEVTNESSLITYSPNLREPSQDSGMIEPWTSIAMLLDSVLQTVQNIE
jgi:hypothetical protein